MKSISLVLVQDSSTRHHSAEFGEGLESVEEETGEHKTTLAESAGRRFAEFEPEGTNDNRDDDAPQPADAQSKPILHLERKLSLHQGPDLAMETDSVDRSLGTGTLTLLDGNLEVFPLLRGFFEIILVLANLTVQVSRQFGGLESRGQRLGAVGCVLFGIARCILTFELVCAACHVVGCSLARARGEAETFEIGSGLVDRTKIDLLSSIND